MHIFLPWRERNFHLLQLNQTLIAGLVGGRFPSKLAVPGAPNTYDGKIFHTFDPLFIWILYVFFIYLNLNIVS